jgi:hypothetical protein
MPESADQREGESMIGPIDGRGGWLQGLLDRFPRLDALLDGRLRPDAPSVPNLPDLGGAHQATGIAAINVRLQVSQMLQSIGGGVQQDQTLQMLITLMVLLALLQPQQRTDSTAASTLLDMLLRTRSGQQEFQFSWSYSSVNIETSFIQGQAADPASGGQGLDVCG